MHTPPGEEAESIAHSCIRIKEDQTAQCSPAEAEDIAPRRRPCRDNRTPRRLGVIEKSSQVLAASFAPDAPILRRLIRGQGKASVEELPGSIEDSFTYTGDMESTQ